MLVERNPQNKIVVTDSQYSFSSKRSSQIFTKQNDKPDLGYTLKSSPKPIDGSKSYVRFKKSSKNIPRMK